MIIPENSTTSLDYKESTQRFSGAPWFNKAKGASISVIGAGGIGSHTLFMLSRIDPYKIIIYDGDNVEAVNMAGQFYNEHSIGLKKSHAITSLLESFSNYKHVYTYNIPVIEETVLPGCLITICGLDNMAARKLVFNKWAKNLYNYSNAKDMLFIDGRLAAEEFQIYTIKGDDSYAIDKYINEGLFDDSKADPTLCSYKQTSYCASMIGSVITNIVVNHLTNLSSTEANPLMQRPVPFYTYYDASLMYFKTDL